MDKPIRRKPMPGDTVRVGSLPGRFGVVDHYGSTVLLESEHGTRCRAGVQAVTIIETNEGAAE